MTDTELLQQFVRDGAQEAFAQLVRQHVDVVYAAARRQAHGDPHIAEEITQQVFILLAQKAKTLTEDVLLGGWLYNAVRFVARDCLRKEQRRSIHEQKAAAMAEELRRASTPGKQGAMDDAEAILDDAMSDLDEPTRGLLVQRYLQGHSASEVGQRLGISEEAARKRISRAVEELRGLFARRGVMMSATALAEVLAAAATFKAPAGLAASAASAAASSSSAASTVTGGTLLMAIANAKIATGLVIGALLVGAVEVEQGYQYFSSPKARTVKLADAGAKLTGPTMTGTVLGIDGKPLADANIWVGRSGAQASAYPGTAQPEAMTDASGKYTVAQPDGPYVIVVRSKDGYAEVSSQALASGAKLQLQPWGRVEGIVKAGDKPLPRTAVHLWRVGENEELVHHENEVTSDAQGHFVFPQIAPGGTQIYRILPGQSMRSADWQYVEVEPGKTAIQNIGGNGRSVVGRLAISPEMAKLVAFNDKTYYDAEVRLASDPQHAQHTKNETPEQYRAVEEAFGRTDAGKIWKRWMFGSNFLVNRDGTFRIDNLPPGKYTVNIRNFEDQPEVNFMEDVARTEGAFEVPADTVFAISAGGGAATSQPSTDPINIGTLVPKAITRLRPGDVAPQFTVKMVDGTTFNSADQKGKAIVVVFWGTWSNTDRLVAFGDFARKWKSDPRVVIIGDYQSDDDAKAAKWVKDAKLEFPQAKDDTLMHTLDSSWPEAVLISPDGKIVQKHLQGKTLDKFLRRVLGMETSTTKSPASPRSQ